MIKVLILTTNLRVSNGVSSFLMNYFRSLDHSLVRMDLAVYKDIPNPYEEVITKAGGRVFILPSVKHIAKHIKACKEILKEGKYDIIHDNTMHITLPMMLCAMRSGVPVRILHSHNSKLGETHIKDIRNRFLLPFLTMMSTEHAACSRLAGEAMFGNKDYIIIPNVIDGDRVLFDMERRNELRRKNNIENKRLVLSVGRVASQKNPFFAVDIIIEAHKMDESIIYWWIGSGPLDNAIQEYIIKKHADEYIRFWGSRDDVIDFYQMADCFFLPSLFEGLPLTGVEAQAMGLPMVVSDTVTAEMVYTDLVHFVALSDP